jgi:hypothetical protein
MATVDIRDDAIWVRNIEGDAALQERIRRLAPGETMELEVDGVVGRWERMRDGRDGRPTLGIKPISDMRKVWSKWRQQAGRMVEIREVVSARSYLEAVQATLADWNSPEDERAYRDL